jgi:hypothetical protein
MDRYAHLYPEARQAVAAVLDDLIAGASGIENRTEPDQMQTKHASDAGVPETPGC